MVILLKNTNMKRVCYAQLIVNDVHKYLGTPCHRICNSPGLPHSLHLNVASELRCSIPLLDRNDRNAIGLLRDF